VQGNQLPLKILGFTREEWEQARFDDPAAATQFRKLLDSLSVAASGRGGLVGIGPDAILAIARVSPAFARRLRDYYDAADSHWRTKVPEYLELNWGRGYARAELVRSQWATILALLDGSDSDS